MSREDAIRVDGTVVEVLPKTMFRVVLPNGHQVLAHVAGGRRSASTGITLGDRVHLEMTPYDMSQGCIKHREK